MFIGIHGNYIGDFGEEIFYKSTQSGSKIKWEMRKEELYIGYSLDWLDCIGKVKKL